MTEDADRGLCESNLMVILGPGRLSSEDRPEQRRFMPMGGDIPCRLKEESGLEIRDPLDFVKLQKGSLGRAPKRRCLRGPH